MDWYLVVITTLLLLVVFCIGFCVGYSFCLSRSKRLLGLFARYMEQVDRLMDNTRRTLRLQKMEKTIKKSSGGV